MLLRISVSALLILTLSACGGTGSSSEMESSSETGSSNETGISVVPQTLLDPALISQTDSSVTVQAINGGLNPETTLITTRFFCFGEAQTNVDSAESIFDVSGNVVTATTSDGVFTLTQQPGARAGEFIMLNADFDEIEFDLEFNEYGQVFNFSDNDIQLEGCYQRGASLEAAQHRFDLNTPGLGVYTCPIENGDSISFEIQESNSYLADGQIGSIVLDSITTGNSTSLQFATGALQGFDTQYFEDPQSGVQTVVFGATTDRAIFCTNPSTSKPFKLYGALRAPVVDAPSAPISGTYFIDTSVLTTQTRDDSAAYVDFKPTGYVRFGQPMSGGTDCTLTLPNGLPLCEQYQFDGQRLAVIHPWGDPTLSTASSTSNGTLLALDVFSVERLTSVNPSSVIGTWASQFATSGDLSLCLIGSCSGTIIDRTFEFRTDGQFLATSSNDSFSSFNGGLLTTFSNNSSNGERAGSYSISGNTLRLTSSSGQNQDLPIHLTEQGRLVIGEFQYRR